MISIYINDKLADYFGDLTIKKDNPLFAKPDVEPTEHTYTLTLPTTATNADIFSLIQYSLTTPQALSARIEVDGIPVLNGSCIVQSWSNSGYSVYFSGKSADTNVKRLLADTATLQDIISIADTTQTDAGVYLFEGGEDAVVQGYASCVFYRDGELRTSVVLSNLAFDNNYLIRKIASYYGVTIGTLPHVYVMQLGKPTTEIRNIGGQMASWTIINKSIPTITAKEFLCNIAFTFGKRMEIDYRNNAIKFTDLSVASGIDMKGDIESVEYGSQLQGFIDFKEIKPYEYQNTEGEKNNVKYSQDFKFHFGEIPQEDDKEKSFYTNRFSLPKFLASADFNDSVALPSHYEDDDERLNDIALVNFVDEGSLSYLTTFNPEGQNYSIYDKVNEKGVTIKISQRMSPVEFMSARYFKMNYINGMPFFIKSINYKSNGESEIEGYLI